MSVDLKEDGGRRVRKARETRERIFEAALGLFLKLGFDETTLDAIAEAADISRRTFFHYYASKEAILEVVDDSIDEAFRVALTSASRDQTPIEAVQTALQGMIGRFSSDQANEIDRLMHSTEALRARKQANYIRHETALFDALCEVWPDPLCRPGLQLEAMIGIGAMRVATNRWREAPQGRSLSAELGLAFRELQSEMGRNPACS